MNNRNKVERALLVSLSLSIIFISGCKDTQAARYVVENPSETDSSSEGKEPVSEIEINYDEVLKLDAGIEPTVNVDFEKEDYDAKEIEERTFWGYKNLGIAKVDNHLNVRAIGGEDGKLVGKMSNGAACEILSVEGNWAKIKSGEVEGYACTDYLLMGMDAVRQAEETVTPMAVVTADALRVREEPNLEADIVTQVAHGEVLEVSQVLEEGWVEIYVDDSLYYVSEEFIEIKEVLPTAITMTELLYGIGVSDVRVDLCQYAKQFIGNPYVWGGTSLTKGADCSGFVLSIFKKYGVTLPHNAAAQSKYGTYVSMDNIKPGDLVFYGSKKHINHVAIYIGNGQVCHASSKKTGIKISNVNYRTPVTQRSILVD